MDKPIDHTFRNKNELKESVLCACFCCLEIFSPQDIQIWADRGETAICPYCNLDSVIGDQSGYPITSELLQGLHDKHFLTSCTLEELVTKPQEKKEK